ILAQNGLKRVVAKNRSNITKPPFRVKQIGSQKEHHLSFARARLRGPPFLNIGARRSNFFSHHFFAQFRRGRLVRIKKPRMSSTRADSAGTSGATGMGSVNRVFLIGRLGRDPDDRRTGGGTRVSNFSLATDQYRNDRNGGAEKLTEWHRIVAFGKIAEQCN